MKHLIRTLWCIASLAVAFVSCNGNLQPDPDPGTGTDPGQEVVTDTPEEILIGVAQTYAVDSVEVRENDYLFVFANPTPIKLKKDYPEGIKSVILEKKNVRKYSDDGHDISVTFTDGKTAVLSRESRPDVNFYFADGTVSKSFSFREYERLFVIWLAEADRTVEVSASDGCDGWLKTNVGNETVDGVDETFVRVLLSENTGDTERSATVTLTRPGLKGGLVISVSQLGAKMPGSLRRALTAFHDGLNGDDWVNSENWCTDRPLHEWYGIKPCSDMVSKECMGETGVTYYGTDDRWALELKSNNMRGQIPQEFWECDALADITINREYLPTTTVPDCVWREGLTTLDLSTTFISVPLTASIARAENLRTLNLELCPVNGELPAEIASLTKLEYLNLYLNSLTGQLPGNIGNMKALKKIIIVSNPGFGGTIPDSFYDLKNLQSVEIGATAMKGTISKKISNLRKLECLTLIQSEFEGTIPEEIGELPHLIDWSFEKNYFDAIPEFVRYRAYNCRTSAGTFMQNYGDWTAGGFSVGVPYCQKRKGYQYSDYYIEELYSVYDDILVDGQPLRRTRLIRDYPKGALKHFILPIWAHVKYGFLLWAMSSEFKNPVFPHSDDLQYPASEYYYDGKDWRHPSLEYPAKEYWKDGDEWKHDASCPWEEEYWFEDIDKCKALYGYYD